jgi:hypothetical protein
MVVLNWLRAAEASMKKHLVNRLSFLALLLTICAGSANAQQSAREIITTKDSDYFGFDLRSERDITQDQCETVCLAESTCRAFTYNVKAKWCFLKSDFNQLKPFPGAVAGKVVEIDGQPDIGAPTELAFYPAYLVDEARQYRENLLVNTVVTADQGLAGLTTAAENAMRNSDPRTAVTSLVSAIKLSPDDSTLWNSLAAALAEVKPINSADGSLLTRDGGSASYNAYLTSRATTTRADALTAVARSLDKRNLFRPSLQAYEAALALAPNASVQAEYRGPESAQGLPRRRAHGRRRHGQPARLRPVLRGSGQVGRRLFDLCHRRRPRPRRRGQGPADLRRGAGARPALQASPSARACPAAIGEPLWKPRSR